MNMILYIDLTIYIRVFSWNKNALFTFKLFFIYMYCSFSLQTLRKDLFVVLISARSVEIRITMLFRTKIINIYNICYLTYSNLINATM